MLYVRVAFVFKLEQSQLPHLTPSAFEVGACKSENYVGANDIKRCLPISAYIIGWLTTPALLRNLLRSSCHSFVTRMVISGNPHRSEKLDIHSSDTVIVGFVT